VGRVCLFERDHIYVARRYVDRELIPAEETRLHAAIEASRAELMEIRSRLDALPEHRVLLDAHLLMLSDALLVDSAIALLRQKSLCAEWALAQTTQVLIGRLRAAPEAYFRERARDIESVGERILRALSGSSESLPELAVDSILVADDLGPTEAAQLLNGKGRGLAVDLGSASSHTAILARALDIPAVVGVRGLSTVAVPDDWIIVDGFRGRIVLRPTPDELRDAEERGARYRKFTLALRGATPRTSTTLDGVAVPLYANVELPKEVALARDEGALGVGLYRTEFLFLDRKVLPTEQEQVEVYTQVVRAAGPGRVVFRTFDLGGDRIHGFGNTGMNPALGLRAVRFGLSEPALFGCQLRAMLRASVHGDVWIMFPLISCLEELRAARAHLDAAREALAAEGVPTGKVRVGCMIEVPSAALLSDALARECDFFSVGTNDLAQYTMAVDRSDPRVARLANNLHPALLQLLDLIAKSASARSVDLTLCGAMGADLIALPVLLGLGYRNLSIDVSFLPVVRAAIGRIDCAKARLLGTEVLQLSTAADVRRRVLEEFGAALGDLWDEQGLVTA
jgi:phosphotransferase system enzyme I (PtsI)